MIDLILHDGIIITMNESREIIEKGSVVVNKNRIIDIGKSEIISSKYEAKKYIDCKNKIILPGLIDTHGHGGHSMFKTIALDNGSSWMKVMTNTYKNYVSDDFWYYEGKLSSLERLKSGVTTGVCVLGSMPRADDPIFAINHAKGYEEVGTREIVCTGPCNPPWPHRFSRWEDGKKIEKLVKYEDVLKSTENVIENLNHSNGDKIRAFVTPFVIISSVNPSNSTPADQLMEITPHDKYQAKKIREIAKKYNTRIHSDAFGGMVHIAYQDKENALLGPDVHLQHCRGLSFDEAKIIAETGTKVSSAPGFGQVKDNIPMIEMMEMGVDVSISTDGTSPSSTFDMFQAMRKTQMYQQALRKDSSLLPPGKLLEMITIDAAKCLGWEDELGSLEVGKKADIITVDIHQPHLTPNFMYVHRLIHEAVASDVDNVIIDGEILMENRNVKTVDEKIILDEANKVSWETIKRAGIEKYMQQSDYFWGHTKNYSYFKEGDKNEN